MILLPLKDEKKNETMLSAKEFVKEMKVTSFLLCTTTKKRRRTRKLGATQSKEGAGGVC